MAYLIPGKGVSYDIVVIAQVLENTDYISLEDSIKDHLIAVHLEKNFKKQLFQLNPKVVVVTKKQLWTSLTGLKNPQHYRRYVVPEKNQRFQVIYAEPPTINTLDQFREALKIASSWIHGSYAEPTNPVKVKTLFDPKEIERYLESILDQPCACDIETFSLHADHAGIGTIAFSTDETSAVAFPVDLGKHSTQVRDLLLSWFQRRNAQTLYHNASFDVHILIHQLWMKGIHDITQVNAALPFFTRNIECTQIITYLATNNAQGNSLSLKDQAQEYLGKWSVEDIKDITKVPLQELLVYNGMDAAATVWLYKKYMPKVIEDKQQDIYENVLKPSLVDVIQMQLTGLPFSMQRAKRAYRYLTAHSDRARKQIESNPLVIEAQKIRAKYWVEERNSVLKKKRVSVEDFKNPFNINSDAQLSICLYTLARLPVINRTDTGLPSCDGDTLTALKNHTDDPVTLSLIQGILDYRDSSKILSTFFPALLNTLPSKDGWHYVRGSYKLGGTVSGRMSSSNPNMQQMPSTGATYAKLWKYIFCAPPGYILCGADFASLEERINTLLTKDKNKEAVYTQGYDGHSFRAFYYWKDKMPDIVDTVESINSIKDKYPSLRQASKTPTFALQFSGTYLTLMKNCGFSKEEAMKIEANYHQMYEMSDKWMQDKLIQASKDGYVTGAFGLRIRTPMLAKYGLSNPRGQAEGRTVGNAIGGQSYGLLNNRAATAVMNQARKQNRPIYLAAQIHDAQYYIVKRTPQEVQWLNQVLPEEMAWQELEEIQHPQIGLKGSLELFRFSWARGHTVPKDASLTTIQTLLEG